MSTVQEIESAILHLPPAEMRNLHEWLEDLLEDQREWTDEFKAQVGRSELEMSQGLKPRLRQP